MENATKALIMAATILISVVIVSLGVYLFATFGSYSSQVDADTRANQISQFNSQFLKYQGQEVTIYDIITVANLAKENNDNYELTISDANENTLYIKVDIIGKATNPSIYYFETVSRERSSNSSFMQAQIVNGELKKYDCTSVKVSPVTERVYHLEFKEK